MLFTPKVLRYDKLKEPEVINLLGAGWDNRWRYIKQGSVEVKLSLFCSPRVQLSYVRYNNAIMIDGTPPKGSVMVSLVRTDGVSSFQNRKLNEDELVIVRYGEEINYLANDINEIYTIVIEESFFDRLFFRYFNLELNDVRCNYRVSIDRDRVDDFIINIERWLLYFDNGDSPKVTADVVKTIEEDILEPLFRAFKRDGVKYGRDRFNMSKIITKIEENINNIYSISDLVDELGVNARTLQYNFKTHLGITAKQYLHTLRLNAIRDELLTSDGRGTTISSVALKYSFFHHSHFTFEYKKLFGETPSDTLMKDRVVKVPKSSKVIDR